jgi:hypothetical protein
MRRGGRVMLVVTTTPHRGARLAGSEPRGLPPRDIALLAAQLMHLGAEVRVLDQDSEKLSDAVVRREGRLWRAQLVLAWAGGSLVADDPVPDERPLANLVQRWPTAAPVIAAGPLARHYGPELLARLPALAGAMRGPVSGPLAEVAPADEVPGLLTREGEPPAVSGPPADPEGRPILPAWQTLPLDACSSRAPLGLRVIDVLCGGSELESAIAQIRHAVLRGGVRRLAFVDRDFARDPEFARAISSSMLAAAPGLPWSCRVRADHLDRSVAVSLFNGGCRELLVTAPFDVHATGRAPMDDTTRPRLEAAVEICRVTGLNPAVEFVVGRPGHTREMVGAWQRWFAARRMVVHARVRLVHAGGQSPGRPTLEEARDRAGCFDNELTPRDVVRAVRELCEYGRLQPGLTGA